MATEVHQAQPDAAAARRPPRPWLWLAAGALLPFVALAGWLGLGLLAAARDARAAAGAARADLARAQAALRVGDQAAAGQAVRTAEGDLARADAVARRLQVRAAGRLPLLSTPVWNLRHLLAGGHVLTAAADRAVAMEARFTGPTKVFADSRFDLGAIDATVRDAGAMLGQLGAARRQLDQVRGGPLAFGGPAERDAALRQVGAIEGQVRGLDEVLQALPAAVGAAGPRTYVVAIANSAQLKAWGGTPLALAVLQVDGGQLQVVHRGELSSDKLNLKVHLPLVPGDPWHYAGRDYVFTASGISPHFPTSGEQILRALEAISGVHADGVLALDPIALAGLLRVSGPVTTPGYGTVRGGDLVRLVLADGYRRYPDQAVRHRYNTELMDAVLGRVLKGGQLLPKLRVLGGAAAGRHLQIYSRDPRLQDAARRHGLAGALSPAPQDYLGVFTLNGNDSKTDYYQRRSIEQLVRLAPDGSAQVERTIRLTNTAPRQPGVDIQRGYFTGWARPVVAAYLPGDASDLSVMVDGRRSSLVSFREQGREVVKSVVDLPPGASGTVTVGYRLPNAAVPSDGGLRYQLVADTQPIVQPAELRVLVIPPAGFAAAGAGWSRAGGGVELQRPLTRGATLNLSLRP